MQYNIKVSFYDNEIQISRYGYKIYSDKEKEIKDADIPIVTFDGKQYPQYYQRIVKDIPQDAPIAYDVYEIIDDMISGGVVQDDFSFAYSDIQHFHVHFIDDSCYELTRIPVKKEINKELQMVYQKRSERRSKQSIYDLARSNRWDYFATFTFAENRYDFDSCKTRLLQWFNNFKKRYLSCLEFLAVPELHKDGAWHFHALIQGDLSDYLVPKIGGNFGLKQYHFGICEFEPVRDMKRVSMYITKYISKDLTSVLKYKRRYFCSKGLKRSQDEYFLVDSDANILDFLKEHYPDYFVTHSKRIFFNDKPIDYLQLKKE